jgi:molecular chaperone GrpE
MSGKDTAAGTDYAANDRVSQKQATALADAESLLGRAQSAEQQRDEFRRLLQSTQADFENYQKRMTRERAEEQRYAHAALARELLPLVDNLQLALDAAPAPGDPESLIKGVHMIRAQMLDMLRRFGISAIEAEGKPFDPTVHEAVLQRAGNNAPEGTILQVLEPGYRLHDRILRPARVVVAARQES